MWWEEQSSTQITAGQWHEGLRKIKVSLKNRLILVRLGHSMRKRQYRERCGKAARDKTGEWMGEWTGEWTGEWMGDDIGLQSSI